MISEKYFVKNYPAFWKELFPLSNIISKALTLQSKQNVKEMPLKTSGRRISFVSEIGFSLFSKAISDRFSISRFKRDNPLYQEIEQQCASKFEMFDDEDNMLNDSLNQAEFSDAKKFASQLKTHFSKYSSIIVSPQFKGCGIIDSCYGDILADNILFEIKSVNRNFHIQDLRQVMTYCAMNYSSKQYDISYIGLYNPRRNVQYVVGTNEFAELISGTNFDELCWKIIYFLSQERSSK